MTHTQIGRIYDEKMAIARAKHPNTGFNPELWADAMVQFDGASVTLYPSTYNKASNTMTGTIRTGEAKGKCTTVYLDRVTPIEYVSNCCYAPDRMYDCDVSDSDIGRCSECHECCTFIDSNEE